MTKHVINNPGGRKPLPEDEVRSVSITVRYTPKEMKRLNRKRQNMAIRVYIREGSLNAVVRLPVSKELAKEVRDLNNLGTNINFLALSARRAGFDSIADKCEKAADGICKILHEARLKIKPKEEENDSLLNG